MTKNKLDDPRLCMRAAPGLTEGLHAFGRKYGGGTLVELGVWQGESTLVHAKYFDYVLGVDPWELTIDKTLGDCVGAEMHPRDMRWAHAQAHKNTYNQRNVMLINAFDMDVEPFIGKVDGVYIDAVHTDAAVSRQIKLWLPHCTRFIAGHDYDKRFRGVMKAVDREFADRVDVFEDTTWAVKL